MIRSAGTVTWVDGGMLRNFPVTALDRIDGRPPRSTRPRIQTTFMDDAGIGATDFTLTDTEQQTSFLNGVQAATDSVIEMAGRHGVRRTPIGPRSWRPNSGPTSPADHLSRPLVPTQVGALSSRATTSSTTSVVEASPPRSKVRMPSAATPRVAWRMAEAAAVAAGSLRRPA